MLALYHMVGGTPVEDLPGLDQLMSRTGLTVPAKVNRAVLVGTSRGPQDVISLEGGRKIRTTWGELAWQLGGAEAFAMLAENDERGIAPGSNLLEALFKKSSPALILIDEWVQAHLLTQSVGTSRKEPMSASRFPGRRALKS